MLRFIFLVLNQVTVNNNISIAVILSILFVVYSEHHPWFALFPSVQQPAHNHLEA